MADPTVAADLHAERRVASTMDAAVALERLRASVSGRIYSTPGRNSSNFIRLSGQADDPSSLAIIGTPYVIPGVPAGYGALPLRFRGRLEPRQPGCALIGTIDVVPAGPGWFRAVFGFIDRHNEHVAMRGVEDFERFLTSLVNVRAAPRSLEP